MARANMFLPAIGREGAQSAALNQKWESLSAGIDDPKCKERWNPLRRCWEGSRRMHMGLTTPEILSLKKETFSHQCEMQEAHLAAALPRRLNEDGTTSDITPFTTTALMLQRTWMPRHMGFDWFGVYPISQPSGKVFFRDYKRDDGSLTSLQTASLRNNSFAAHTENDTTKKIKGEMTELDITMYSRALMNESSVESVQDFYAYFGLLAAEEDRAAMADEILRESEGTCLSAVLSAQAGGNVNWCYTVPDGLDYTNQLSYNRSLFNAVIDAQNLIYLQRFRSPNWMVGGVNEMARLQKLSEFTLSQGLSDGDFTIGRHYYGTINNSLNAYRDPYFPTSNTLLFGIKGYGMSDSPAVWSPYVGFFLSDKITDPTNFNTRQGVLTRFGFTILRPECYSTLTYVSSL